MKHKLFLTAIWLSVFAVSSVLSSCEKVILPDMEEQQDSPSSFTFSLFLPATRATSVSDFQRVVILDIKDGSVQQVLQQSPSDADFGNPTITLANGTHTLRFLATDASNASFNGTSVSQSPLGDTFVQSVSIDTRTADATQRVVLSRNVARIRYTGEGTATVSGILSTFDLLTYEAVGEGRTATLQQNEELYSFVPANGALLLADGTVIPVSANALTVISDDGTDITPGTDTPAADDLLVLTNDTAQFYVPKMEITNVTLSTTPDPRTKYANQMKPYRMPTRTEAAAIRRFTLPADYWSGARCLCYDRPEDYRKVGTTEYGTGKYYTFTWADSNTGGTTVAGEKTAYSIKPVRMIPLAPLTARFSLDADFTWGTDTTKVNIQH